MTRTALMLALAALALATPGRSLAADTVYVCTPDEPRASAPDRLVSVEIRLRPNGEFVSVAYRAADGSVFDRSRQYQAINGQENNHRYWVGRLRSNPDVGIMGSFERSGGRLYYYETIRDMLQGGKVVSRVISVCDAGRIDRAGDEPRAGPRDDAGSNVVPVSPEGGGFTVPVVVNGAIRLNFLIDSGASDVVIPADVFRTLWRSGTIDESDILGEQRYSLADGSKHTTIRFRLRSVRVGAATLSNVTASVTPAAASPLLGQSFLSRFRSWSLDNRRRVLILN